MAVVVLSSVGLSGWIYGWAARRGRRFDCRTVSDLDFKRLWHGSSRFTQNRLGNRHHHNFIHFFLQHALTCFTQQRRLDCGQRHVAWNFIGHFNGHVSGALGTNPAFEDGVCGIYFLYRIQHDFWQTTTRCAHLTQSLGVIYCG